MPCVGCVVLQVLYSNLVTQSKQVHVAHCKLLSCGLTTSWHFKKFEGSDAIPLAAQKAMLWELLNIDARLSLE